MGSLYTGDPDGYDGYNSPPAPNGDVKLYLPVDTDPNNCATMFNQQIPRIADNLQYLIDGYSSFRGTTSFKGLVINGTGGTAVTPSGTLSVSGTSTFTGLATFVSDSPGLTTPTAAITREYNGGLSTLNGGIDASVTTITLTSGYGFWTGGAGEVKIDNEIIAFGSVSSNQLLSCTRGAESTTPASHSNGAVVKLVFSGGSAICPSPATFTMYRELVPVAMCGVGATGAMKSGFGIYSITHIPNGNYDVVLINPDPSGIRLIVAGTIAENVAGTFRYSQTATDTIRVVTYDSAWTQTDKNFSMVVYLC